MEILISKNTNLKIPKEVRIIIWSYLDLMTLLDQTCKLSTSDRWNLLKSENLN